MLRFVNANRKAIQEYGTQPTLQKDTRCNDEWKRGLNGLITARSEAHNQLKTGSIRDSEM